MLRDTSSRLCLGRAMMRAGLTATQRRLLDFIANFIAAHGYSPSYAEMKNGLGFASTGAVAPVVAALEERGHIRRLPGRHRSIALTERPPSFDEHSVSRETSERA